MSNTIDERVVVLRFDNAQFENATKTSMKTLKDLDASLEKQNGAKGLKKLGDAANSINLTNLANNIDTVGKRFSTLGVVGMSAINNLTNSFMGLAKKIIFAVPNQIKQGGLTRAMNIEQARFQIQGLKKDWDALYEDMDYAVTGTAYGIDEAARAASQLSASGIEAGDDMKGALRGISGVAAMTNSSYSDISNIFTKVAGQGRVMANELNQVAARGLNIAQPMAEYMNKVNAGLVDADDQTKALIKDFSKGKTVTEDIVRNSKGSIDKMIFFKAMDYAFGEQATKANDTYSGSLSNVKAALSRIGEDRQKVRLENLMNIFNALKPVIDQIRNIMAPLTKAFNTFAIKGAQKVVDILHSLWERLEPLSQKLKVVRTNFDKYFDGLRENNKKARDNWNKHMKEFSEGIAKANNAAKKGTEGTKKSIKSLGDAMTITKKESQAAWDIWLKGSYGNQPVRSKNLAKVGLEYKRVQGYVNALKKANFDASKTGYKIVDSTAKTKEAYDKTTKAAKTLANAFEGINKAQEKQKKGYPSIIKSLQNMVIAFRPLHAIGETFKGIFTVIKNLLKALWTVLKPIISALINNIGPVIGKLLNLIAQGAKKLGELTGKIKVSEKATTKIYNAITKVFDVFRKVFGRLKETAILLGKTLGPAFKQIGIHIKDFFKTLNKNSRITGALKKFGTWLLDMFFKLMDAIDKFIVNVGPFFKKLFESEGFQHLKDSLGKIFEIIKGMGKKGLDKVVKGVKSISDSTNKIDDKKVDKLGAFAGILSKIADKVAYFFDMLREGKGPFEMLYQFFGKLKAMKGPQKFFQTLGKNVQGFFKNLKEGKLTGQLGQIFGAVKDLHPIELIKEKLKQLDVKNMLDEFLYYAKQFLRIWSTIKMVKSASSMMSGIGDMARGIGGFFKTLSATADQARKKIKAETFRVIASSVLMLAGSMWIIAQIPKEKLAQAVIVIGSVFGAITGLMIAVDKAKVGTDKIASIGAMFAGIGVSLFLIATAMKMISKMSGENIVKSASVIFGFLGAFMLMGKIMGKSGFTGASGFVAMALAINLLIPPLFIFAKMKWKTIAKGGGVIFGLMMALVLAANLAKEAGKGTKHILALALAVDMIAGAMLILSMIPIKATIKALAVVETLLITIGLITKQMAVTKSATKVLKQLGRLIAIAAASLATLSFINPGRLLASALALDGTLIVIAAVLKTLTTNFGEGQSKKMLAAVGIIGLVLAEVVAAFVILDKLNVQSVLPNAVGLSAVIVAVAVALKLMTMGEGAGTASTLKAAGIFVAAMGIVIDGLAGIFASLAAITNKFGKGGKLIIQGAKLAGDMIGEFIGSIVSGFKKAAEIKEQDKGPFERLTDSVIKLVDKLSKIKGLDNLSASVKNITGALLQFTAGEFINGINKLTGFSSEDISEKLGPLADAMVDFIKKFDGVDLTNMESATTAAENLAAVAKAMPVFQSKMENFDSFVDQIPKLGMALLKFSISTITLTSKHAEGATNAAKIADNLAKVAQKMPLMNVRVDENFSSFISNIPKLGNAMFLYSLSTISLTPQHTAGAANATSIAQNLADMASSLPMFKWTAEDKFIAKLPDLGKALFDFAKNVSGIADDAGDKAYTASKMGKWLGEMVAGLSNWKGKAMKNFINYASSLGKALSDFATNITATTFDETKKDVIKNISESLTGLKVDTVTIDFLTNKLPTVGTTISDYFTNINSVDTTKTDAVIEAIKKMGNADFSGVASNMGSDGMASMASSISSSSGKISSAINTVTRNMSSSLSKSTGIFRKAGSRMMSSLSSGISGAASKVKSASNKVVKTFGNGLTSKASTLKTAGKKMAGKAADGADDKSSFNSSANNDVQGLYNGLTSAANMAKLYRAGTKMAQKVNKGYTDHDKIKSPSRLYMKMARYDILGIVRGIDRYGHLAYNAGDGLAAGLSETMETAMSLSDGILENGVEPTITPVLDLSSVRNGVGMINSAFGNRQLALASSINGTLQNGSNSLESTVTDLTKRLDYLTDTMNSRQMINYITVDGSQDPELFADRLVRKLKIDMRSM